MGTTGKSSTPPFDWVEFARHRGSKEIAKEIESRLGIHIVHSFYSKIDHAAFGRLAEALSEMTERYQKDFGFSPVYEIIDYPDGYMGISANASKDNKNQSFLMHVSADSLNNDFVHADRSSEMTRKVLMKQFENELRESVAHEFAHGVYAYLQHNYNNSNGLWIFKNLDIGDYSQYDGKRDSKYNQWQTKEAKQILLNAFGNTAKYKDFLSLGATYISEGDYKSVNQFAVNKEQAIRSLETFAINHMMKWYISNYATASYQEAISECFAREYTGRGNECSAAVFNEVKKQFKQKRKKK